MPTTKVDVANGALAFLGSVSTQQIEDFEEDTADARKVRRFYDVARLSFLEHAWWSFATKYAALTVKEEDPDPPQWRFSYVVPQDFAAPRKVIGVFWTPDENNPFEMAVDLGAIILYTNTESACLEYTATVDDFGLWPGSAITAFELALAIRIAPTVTGGVGKVNSLRVMEARALEEAMVLSHNSQERDPIENESTEFIDARFGRNLRNNRAPARFKRA